MQLHLAAAAQNSGLHLRMFFVNRSHASIAFRLRHHGDFQQAGGNVLPRIGKAGAQAFETMRIEHGPQLVRRAGQQNDHFIQIADRAFQPLSGCGAFGILQRNGAGDDVPLLGVVFRHLHAAGSKAGIKRGDDIGIAAQGKIQSLGDRFASEIVFGRAESAHENDQLSALQGDAGDGDQVFEPVSNHRFVANFDAKLVQFFREIKRVGILTEGSEQFGADGDDLCGHCYEFNSAQRSGDSELIQQLFALDPPGKMMHSAGSGEDGGAAGREG